VFILLEEVQELTKGILIDLSLVTPHITAVDRR
jgi:hypothetical protein